jgi:hypothetical protein
MIRVMDDRLAEFVAAAPRVQRPAVRLLLALARRPRGLALLSRLAPADQAAAGLQAMARYDDPATARALGFDADAVVARGRELRRREGRP